MVFSRLSELHARFTLTAIKELESYRESTVLTLQVRKVLIIQFLRYSKLRWSITVYH